MSTQEFPGISDKSYLEEQSDCRASVDTNYPVAGNKSQTVFTSQVPIQSKYSYIPSKKSTKSKPRVKQTFCES